MAYNNDRRDNHDNKGYHKNKEYTTKPVYVTKKIPLGSSSFYDNNLTELYNLLDKITFELISIPVTMSRSLAIGPHVNGGYVTIGSVVSFSNNEFVISMKEQYANRIDDNFVVIVNVHKDVNDKDLFTRVNSISIREGVSAINAFDDLYEQFDEADSEQDDLELVDAFNES